MEVIRSLSQMQSWSRRQKQKGLTVGFVPTMGALHEGHLSLVRKARAQNQRVVVSVFVNPTQFSPNEDLSRYPRPWKKDRAALLKEKVDVVFYPTARAMYPVGFQTWIDVADLSRPLCGPFRPGHFRGVATVVARLFQLVQPDRAYFGRKDYQQLKVIERLVKDLHLPVRVVSCPTVRERDRLAMSSRNVILSAEDRAAAAVVPAALKQTVQRIRIGRPISVAVQKGLSSLRKIPRSRVDYLEVWDADTLQAVTPATKKLVIAVAVRLGKTRLIDNQVIVKP